MNKKEFEQFVTHSGRDILRFCRVISQNEDAGSELYQDTMLKLLEKRSKLDTDGNVKSYALSVAILLQKNRKKKAAIRNQIAPVDYGISQGDEDDANEPVNDIPADEQKFSPEMIVLQNEQKEEVRKLVALLPENLKMPVYLFYTADMKIAEIAEVLEIPEGTVKTRLRSAKNILKTRLEELGYDR